MSQDLILAPELAPGCFGSALAFSKTDMVCSACPFAKTCEPAHMKSKMALKEKFGIGFKEKAKIVAKTEKGTVELTTDKKTEAVLKWIEMMNVGVHDKLKQGINPFGSKTRFLSIFCHMLLTRPRSNNAQMVVAMMATLKCDEKSANAYLRIAAKAMLHLGVIENKDGIYELRRN